MKKLIILNIILFLCLVGSLIYSQLQEPVIKVVVEKEIVKVPEIREVEVVKEVQSVVYKTKFVNKCEDKQIQQQQATDQQIVTSQGHHNDYFEEKKNRISAFIAYGPKKIDYKLIGGNYDVEMKSDILLGAMYSRKINKDWSVFAGVITNNTYMLGTGMDY